MICVLDADDVTTVRRVLEKELRSVRRGISTLMGQPAANTEKLDAQEVSIVRALLNLEQPQREV